MLAPEQNLPSPLQAVSILRINSTLFPKFCQLIISPECRYEILGD